MKAHVIVAEIAREHNCRLDDLLGKDRRFAKPRRKAIQAVAKAFPEWSRSRVGQVFGGRSHATIYYHIENGRRGPGRPGKPGK